MSTLVDTGRIRRGRKGPWKCGWMSCQEARMLLKVSSYMLMKLSLVGLIGTRALPGQNLEFSRRDIEKLVKEDMKKPARKRASK